LEGPDRRVELIRARLEAYYEAESRGPLRATWRRISEEIFDATGVKMDSDSLRQFVKRTMRRGQPRVPDPKNLEAILSFLCDPEIDMLSRDEVENPSVPSLLARLFLDFLRSNEENEPTPPLTALLGYYRAVEGRIGSLPKRTIDISLRIEGGENVIRLSEFATKYAYRDSTPGVPPRREIKHRLESEGWAIFTPEENLMIFMKQKRYGRNHYYLSLGMDRNVWSGDLVNKLILLRHEYPVLQQEFYAASFDSLSNDSDGDTNLLWFKRLTEQEIESSQRTS
jgi:hypothetical protein